MGITRGTTPKIYLRFDPNWDMVDTLTVTFKQWDCQRLQLEKSRFTYDDGKISTRLTQEETLGLIAGATCEIQIKVGFIDDPLNIVPSTIVEERINEILDEELML